MPDIDVRVRRDTDKYELYLGCEKLSSAATLHDAARAIVKVVDGLLVHRLKSLYAVHAGAVVLHGKALLVPGSTHAGKSSLIAEFLRRGALLLSDEYALVDPNGLVHAYPRPLLVRDGSPEQTLILPKDLNASFAAEPVAVAWIFAIEYDPGSIWHVTALSNSETVMLLLRNTPHEMDKSPEMIDSFVRLAANAACYAGVRGEAAETVDQILQMVSGT